MQLWGHRRRNITTTCVVADGPQTSIACEYDDLGSCRVMYKGQKDLLLIDMTSFMEWADGLPEPPPVRRIEEVEQFWQKTPLSIDKMMTFVEACPMGAQYVVHKVGELLYVPQGWLTISRSRAQNKLPVFGYRTPILTNSPRTLGVLDRLTKKVNAVDQADRSWF